MILRGFWQTIDDVRSPLWIWLTIGAYNILQKLSVIEK